ncbi:MAG: hypothetical protein RLZZ200_333 [Pseudomonadota bacterium]|jgi:alkylated DNA repair protein (DNA oxidative demethylase)
MPRRDPNTPDLFAAAPRPRERLAPGAWLLPGFASERADTLLSALPVILDQAPWRRPLTPGGRPFSVEMTNCGARGWVSDAGGYRYTATDPVGGRHWAPLPPDWRDLAGEAARAAGYPEFEPDACLVNRYVPGASMGLHQDRDEPDLSAPIVSVSLGLSAVFLFGGPRRADRPARIPLAHSDVVVWGGSSRLNFHGIARLKDGLHPVTGCSRINLTFRKSG